MSTVMPAGQHASSSLANLPPGVHLIRLGMACSVAHPDPAQPKSPVVEETMHEWEGGNRQTPPGNGIVAPVAPPPSSSHGQCGLALVAAPGRGFFWQAWEGPRWPWPVYGGQVCCRWW